MRNYFNFNIFILLKYLLEGHGQQVWLIKVMQRLVWIQQQMDLCFNKDLTRALVRCYEEMLQLNLDAGQLLYVYCILYIVCQNISENGFSELNPGLT